MTDELWATLITTVVVPVVLRVLVHYFPWLADAVTPGTSRAAGPRPPEPERGGVYDLDADEGRESS
jgi:hypothetical protein